MNNTYALLGIDGSDGWGGLTPEKAVTDMQSFSDNYLISRFATASFLLLKGKREELIKRYHQEKTLLSCEKQLLARLEAEKAVPDADRPALTRCLSSYNDRGMPKTSGKECLAVFRGLFCRSPLHRCMSGCFPRRCGSRGGTPSVWSAEWSTSPTALWRRFSPASR